MSFHREKQLTSILIGIGVFLVLASLWVLFFPESAWKAVISFGLSAIVGFLVSAILNAILAYILGIRYNPKVGFTIDYKFTKKWFSTTYSVLTVATGTLLTLIIISSDEIESITDNIYSSFVQQGFVQFSIFAALIGLMIGVGSI